MMIAKAKERARAAVAAASPNIYIITAAYLVVAEVIGYFDKRSDIFDKIGFGFGAGAVYNPYLSLESVMEKINNYVYMLSPMQRMYLVVAPAVIWIISTLLGYGHTISCLKTARGRAPEISDLWEGAYNPWRIWIAEICMSIAIGVGFMCFLVPGVVLALAYSKTLMLMIDDPKLSPLQAMSRSRLMMRGRKTGLMWLALSFFGLFFAAVILALVTARISLLLGALASMLCQLWIMPYFRTTHCVHYLMCLAEDRARPDNLEDHWE